MTSVDVLVVGAGFAGCSVARALADRGYRVHVVERRPHIGGNAFDELDEHGVRVHRYGPHIFHTNAPRILAFLSRFTRWRPYEHRVRARIGDALVPFPVNRATLNALFGLHLDEAGAAAWLERAREPRAVLRNSEDVVLASVGRELCDLFYRGYTRKQWGLDLADLAPGVAARIGVRVDDDDRYFQDRFQCMPEDGYTAMFARMLAHDAITFETGTEGDIARQRVGHRHLVHTGPIDALFDRCFGRLPYRSLHFEHIHHRDTPLVQPVATINYPNDERFTRVTEFRHLTGQPHRGTSIVREYACAEGEPFYPIPRPANVALYRRYRALAARNPDVTLVGRLAQYRYYNMDQAVAAALSAAARVHARLASGDANAGAAV